MTPEQPARHHLVWVSAAALAACRCPEPARDIVAVWLKAKRPLISRRRQPGDPEDQICLGLPLPPAQGKLRIPLCVPPHAIERVAPPPALADALVAAPTAWQPTLLVLADRFADLHLLLRCYGSLAWQSLTQEPYLAPASDVDLLMALQSQAQLTLALDILQAYDQRQEVRIDGEFLFPDGRACAWRELAAAPDQVLVKTLQAAHLMETARLLDSLH